MLAAFVILVIQIESLPPCPHSVHLASAQGLQLGSECAGVPSVATTHRCLTLWPIPALWLLEGQCTLASTPLIQLVLGLPSTSSSGGLAVGLGTRALKPIKFKCMDIEVRISIQIFHVSHDVLCQLTPKKHLAILIFVDVSGRDSRVAISSTVSPQTVSMIHSKNQPGSQITGGLGIQKKFLLYRVKTPLFSRGPNR